MQKNINSCHHKNVQQNKIGSKKIKIKLPYQLHRFTKKNLSFCIECVYQKLIQFHLIPLGKLNATTQVIAKTLYILKNTIIKKKIDFRIKFLITIFFFFINTNIFQYFHQWVIAKKYESISNKFESNISIFYFFFLRRIDFLPYILSSFEI